ncbi:MAG: radical SAM protein [Candidatus Woesearchaeota archaeon]
MEYTEKLEFKSVEENEMQEEVVKFLNLFGQESILGEDFLSIVKKGSGEERLNNLLKASKYENDFSGFFNEIKDQLSKANGNPISINGINMPYHFLFFILEILLPGNGFISVKSVAQLEYVTNISIPAEQKNDIQKVIDTYPVRLSMHVIRQMRLSKAIHYQYFPFADELNKEGLINTWVGQFHQGPLEQMYQNRPIFVLNMTCPVYCRFCFRKHKECRNQESPMINDVKKEFEHIKTQPKIKEMLLTGGDPFMNEATLTTAVEEAIKIEHIRTLRIATRSISYYPFLFYNNNKFWLEYLKRTSIKLHQNGKKLEIATHFLHPDEISFKSLNIISELVNAGIPVYVQTPFLKDCNDDGKKLLELYKLLRGSGAEIHYIFMPCTPLQGNRRYVSTIDSGLKVARYLSANGSERGLPKMCTATAIGKIDWFSSGWAIKKQDSDFIWIRTPYTLDYFKEFSPDFTLKAFDKYIAVENEEGTIDITFMVKVENEKLFLGSRKQKIYYFNFDEDKLKRIQEQLLSDQRSHKSFLKGSDGIYRIHKSKIEIDIDQDIDFDYIINDKRIHDVIISSKNDPIDNLSRLEEVLKILSNIEHVFSLRVRSLKFNYSLEDYSFVIINKLGEFNVISSIVPKRVEIETSFLHSSEAKEEHKELTRRLNAKGITVYNNTPIIKDVNNDKNEFEKIANHLRNSGIEFNVAYVNGILSRKSNDADNRTTSSKNSEDSITLYNFLDIASNLRKHGSGREIPRYFLKTDYGDVNFGIDTEFFRKDGKVFAKLLCYTADFFKDIEPDFKAEGLMDDHPVIEVKGIVFEDDFMLN